LKGKWEKVNRLSSEPGRAGWQTVSAELGQGVTASLDVFVCPGANPGPVALVTAGIHGDEYEGPAAVAQLAAELSPEGVSGTLWLIPVANPLAFEAGTRTSPLDGANLARVFPGKANGTPTERLAYFLFSNFAQEAQYLIDLHSGGAEYEFLPVSGFYGEPLPANLSFQAACALGFSALWQLPDTAGVLSREATRAGKIAVGAEYLGGGRLSPEGVRGYTEGVKSCLACWGIWKAPLSRTIGQSRVYGNDWLLSPATGLFHALCKLGDEVHCGEQLAAVKDRRGRALARIAAEHSGVVLGLRSKAYIREQNWSVLVGTELK
jgi:N2-acetyl-L-2,4-diaminobutanoate deacetylase